MFLSQVVYPGKDRTQTNTDVCRGHTPRTTYFMHDFASAQLETECSCLAKPFASLHSSRLPSIINFPHSRPDFNAPMRRFSSQVYRRRTRRERCLFKYFVLPGPLYSDALRPRPSVPLERSTIRRACFLLHLRMLPLLRKWSRINHRYHCA